MTAIRLSTLADAEPILSIYNNEVMASTATFDVQPRTLECQQGWLKDRSGSMAVLVAEKKNRVVGFASLSPYRPTHGYRSSVENSIYIDADYRGQGIGSKLLYEILVLAEGHGFHSIFARISEMQSASLKLHQKYGFTVLGVEKEVGRKFGKWHDVTIMQLLLRDFLNK